MNLKKLLVFVSLIVLIFIIGGCKRKSFDKLLEEGKYKAAERRCKKAAPEKRAACYKTIAAFFLQKSLYKRAAEYYAKAGDHIRVINSYFQGDLIAEAEEYSSRQTGEAKKQCTRRLARKFFINENYQKAIRYYKMSGDNPMVLYIESRAPVFQLADRIDKKLNEIKNPGVIAEMRHIKETLTAYIYMDKYRQWKYDREAEIDKRAGTIFKNALEMLQDRIVPAFVEKLNSSSFDWTEKSVRSVSFQHLKLESVMNLVKSLFHIAGKREFFTKYSVVYQGKSQNKKKEPAKSLNYEQAYLKALDHAGTFLETLEEAEKEKNKEWLKDYKDDLTVDIKVIDYISSMMDNMKIRIGDIERRSRKIRERSEDEAVKKSSEKLFWDFAADCNRVLHAIGKGEYQEANKLLLAGYNTAKSRIDQYTGGK